MMHSSSTSPSQSLSAAEQKKRKRRCVSETKAHRSQEKKRRQLINGSISRLRTLVPACEGQRHTIINVLHATEDYVRELKESQAQLEAEVARLRAQSSYGAAGQTMLPEATSAASFHVELLSPAPTDAYGEPDLRSRTSSPAYSHSNSPSPDAVFLPPVHPSHPMVEEHGQDPEEAQPTVLKACNRNPLPLENLSALMPLPVALAGVTPYPVPPSPLSLLGLELSHQSSPSQIVSLSSDPFFTLM